MIGEIRNMVFLTAMTFAACSLSAPAMAAPTASADQPDVSTHAPATPAQSIDQAIAATAETPRVILVNFTADWCGWCRKMKLTTLADPQVKLLGESFEWAEVDVEKQQMVAAMFEVRGLPTMIALNARGEEIDRQPGYQTAEQMRAWLRELEGQAKQPGKANAAFREMLELRRALSEPGEMTEKRAGQIRKLLLMVASPESPGREIGRTRLVELGTQAWPTLIEALEHPELRVRAAAGDIVRESTGAALAYDPFADASTRRSQVAAWRAWLDKKAGQADADPAPPTDDEQSNSTAKPSTAPDPGE